MDPTGCVDMSPTVESSLYHRVQSILREMDSQTSFHKGMLRWSLHKKLETQPSISVPLIRVLVKELEKADRTNCKMHVIPLLHTLSYVILQQSDSIPNSLCQRVYDCLRKMMTFPEPYSSVVLNKLRDIKMEMATPGALYQRRLIAEQNIQNEHFPLQEKVFVIADPAVFSGPMGAAVRADLEVGNLSRDTLTQERSMVLHALQTVLGRGHQSSLLAEALEALEEDVVQKFTQEVVVAVEQSIEHGAVSSEGYRTKLQVIYNDILTAARGVATPVHRSSLCNTPLPTPQMNFLLWTNEEDLWEALVDFAHTGTDGEREDKRVSVQSVDSGIEKDFRDLELDTEQPCARSPFMYDRKYGAKSTKPADNWAPIRDKTEAPLLREGRTHTARVVVMGDDRVLGRLATVYYSIRERESKCLCLKKLNLQLYYIPVTDVEPVLSSSPGIHGQLSLASLLGRVDPWYASNINSLGVMIPKLAKMHSNCNKTSEENVFLLDVLSYYLRCGTQAVYLPIYSVKLSLSTSDTEVEEMFVSHLHIDFPQFRQLKEKILEGSSKRQRRRTALTFGVVISVSYKKITVGKRGDVRGVALTTCGVEITTAPPQSGGQDYLTVNFDSTNQAQCTEIRTQNLNIRAHEKRTFTVCLDRDSRRTCDNVQRIEISPCLDPGYGLQPEVKLNTYLNKNLSLPINTFSGIIL